MMVEKKFDPDRLVPLLRELQFDDTFNEVFPFMRFDAKLQEKGVATQLLVDLRHKISKTRSKPRFYLTMSSIDQHLNLLTAALAMTLLIHHKEDLNISTEDLKRSATSVMELIKSDAVRLTELLMVDVQKRKMKLKSEEFLDLPLLPEGEKEHDE